MTAPNEFLLPLLIAIGMVLVNVGALLGHPSPLVTWVAVVSLGISLGVVLVAIGLWLADLRRARQAASAPAQRYPLRALDQEQYAALLQSDTARKMHFEMLGDTRGFACVRCKRAARQVQIRHPIWNGPFEGSGSGTVDVRLLSWCPWCNGPLPAEEGQAVRLPFLDDLPIRLLPELYERTAFRSLPDPVELYVPPPPAPVEPAAPGKTTPP